ncbi:hypothetical protein [Streptacidiphilus sp. P02-A3a]|uniref:hypothetical protein n=1 Tax=Streptacidiphilus sp. P02-A3a TaxID=2704468 RepID=UPI0015FA74E3|nr:hypothetical protein [Streptacidiphilus sp. P02-A3a]QMU70921.1 hypothetical protein GXP74_24585 [Streptacidiphilus sp. P02-A3a]
MNHTWTRGVALVFRCRPEEGQAQPSPEATAVNWLSRQQIADRMSEVYAVRVVDALADHDTAPNIRHRDGRTFLGHREAE